MKIKVQKAAEVGFCFGVRRAIETLEKIAGEYGQVDSLGEVVHNEEVLRRLKEKGVGIVEKPDEVTHATAAISAHGVTPDIEAELRGKKARVIDTTCPYVRRAQHAARKLARAGFFVVIFGEANHQEVKGILGWAEGRGLATLNVDELKALEKIPLKVGILSQTTQISENFLRFAKDVVDLTFTKDAEIRIIDTICHDIRRRQTVSSGLAQAVDLMLVVGGRSSANTRRLLELCSFLTETHQINSAAEIDPAWLKGKQRVGITSGTSTPDQTIEEVVERLEKLS
jgi:4-hydroxy-3-methylbut-2-enyl diphosphate reductase